MKIFTTYHDSPVGQLKLQCSDEYITAVLFVDDEELLPADKHPLLDQCIKQLDEYFAGERKRFDLSLRQEGSGFQMRVWDLLLQIPYGKTISYQDLSKQYGDTKAIRAVASANGRNNLAIIVPCHRVIGSNRNLTGYAGGLWRKRWLLEHEAKYGLGVQEIQF